MGFRLGPRPPLWLQHTCSLPLFCALLERRGLRGGVACLGHEPQMTRLHLASSDIRIALWRTPWGLVYGWLLAPRGMYWQMRVA